jgi:hypothetical protein
MIAIVVLAAAFLGCAIVAAIVVLRVGIAREESDKSLLGNPPTRVAAVTRRVVGLYVRTPQRVAEADRLANQTDTGQIQALR